MTECGIYDSTCLKDRTDTTYKRQRKVFKDKPIRVRFMLRNPLLTDITITNLRLCCRFLDEGEEAKDANGGGAAGNGDVKDERKEGEDDEGEFMAEKLEM